MKQLLTRGIVLGRTDFDEADRILTVLTPDHGKLKLVAKGVRRVKSKLAGGIELFSVSQITFILGRGELGTLISTRLIKHYGHIVENIERVQLGYDLIKLLDRATEDNIESDYFNLLHQATENLDDDDVPMDLIKTWFQAQLLRLGGHSPNLKLDSRFRPLDKNAKYSLDLENMSLSPSSADGLDSNHIKALRLLFGTQPLIKISKVNGFEKVLVRLAPLISSAYRQHIRI